MEVGISFMILIFIIINVALFWQNKISFRKPVVLLRVNFVHNDWTNLSKGFSVSSPGNPSNINVLLSTAFPLFFIYFASNGHPFLAWNTAFRSR